MTTAPTPMPAGAVALTPIVLKTAVPCPPDRAFDYFTRDIARWWPLAHFSCAGDAAVDVRFEPRVGGGIVETARDGNQYRWGTVEDWQPGLRVAFTWHPGRDDNVVTRVEVAFAASAEGTLVTLTHSGFEGLGERGAPARNEYANGWPTVFGRLYTTYCRAPEEHRP